jgi:hypothetical protein
LYIVVISAALKIVASGVSLLLIIIYALYIWYYNHLRHEERGSDGLIVLYEKRKYWKITVILLLGASICVFTRAVCDVILYSSTRRTIMPHFESTFYGNLMFPDLFMMLFFILLFWFPLPIIDPIRGGRKEYKVHLEERRKEALAKHDEEKKDKDEAFKKADSRKNKTEERKSTVEESRPKSPVLVPKGDAAADNNV